MTETTITVFSRDDVVVELEKHTKPDTFSTPYKMATAINATLKGLGLERVGNKKELPPQMFYQYVSKGYLNKSVDGDKGVASWLTGYLQRNRGKFNFVGAPTANEVEQSEPTESDLNEVAVEAELSDEELEALTAPESVTFEPALTEDEQANFEDGVVILKSDIAPEDTESDAFEPADVKVEDGDEVEIDGETGKPIEDENS
jgi:hypothetical protein